MAAAGSCRVIPMKAIVTLLLFINFLWLYTYLIDHPNPVTLHLHLHHNLQTHHHHHSSSSTAQNLTETHPHHHPRLPQPLCPVSSLPLSKPWPILPSYLPWIHQKPPSHSSCEAYFGNGFSVSVDLLPRRSPKFKSKLGDAANGWFRCHYSETLRSSICEGGRVRMDPGRIRMSRGGERIEEVLGRKDEEELPVFKAGAFRIGAGEGFVGVKKLATVDWLDEYVPVGQILRHTMHELMASIEIVDESQFDCPQWIVEPTLLLTRFEYANVFHTYTDWYSAYVSSRVTGLPRRPHVVFIDGHSTTRLEETWEALFSSYRFAKNFTSPVCFRHAIFSPLGYETALFKGLTETIDCQGASSAHKLWENPDDHKTARLSEFGEMVSAAFGFPVDRPRNPEPAPLPLDFNVLFVRREDYLAHPRHGGKVESRLSNEQQVFDALRNWVSDHSNSRCRLKLVNGLFAHMPMKEQLRAIQDASVVIGAHGAGLTHMLSASPNTTILEIISSEYRRPHFRLIAQWKGLEYYAINLSGSYAKPALVTAQLKSILATTFGC
ncbi:hypothetical protein Dimus_019196 [Dionaea muscipula]